jgi:putative ABC transport system substrate-binding protein
LRQKKDMKRKITVLTLCATLFALCVPVEAQQSGQVTKFGELVFRARADLGAGRKLLRQELGAVGYVEGKNIAFEIRSAEGKLEQFPALADELVRLKVDILVATSTAEILAFKNATRTIPIVFIAPRDPVAAGLVDSLARPGGNITGFTTFVPALAGKRLELLKETVPNLSRVAVLWNPQDPSSAQQWKENQIPARELGLQLQSIEVSSADKLEDAFNTATKPQCDALTVMAGSLATSNQKLITELAAKHRIPALYHRESYVENGGLMSYGADDVEPYRRVAWMVDKILKGAKPADIPVEQPTKFELAINLKTAKALGLTIPPNLLARADRVIR